MTDRQEVISAIEKALSEVLERQVTELTEDTRLFDDLRLDSSSVLELLLLVEDFVEVTVDPETLDIDHLRTVRSFADYVEGLLTGGDTGP
ncbi:phosphopantetheine-binding protein [Streptomyces sp. NPDC093544]|jgi:acyl carrier protein|uniref:phosphopantetheine-binding protein n=1 Tax=Streptomyces sp. NPDC093544 TaxID=3155200 RepID=UPI00343F8D84